MESDPMSLCYEDDSAHYTRKDAHGYLNVRIPAKAWE